MIKRLDAQVAAADHGYIVVTGPPGSGKTTFLSAYADHIEEQTNQPVGRYYCWLGPRDPYPAARLTATGFVRAMHQFLLDNYPDAVAGQRTFDLSPQRLAEALVAVGKTAHAGGQSALFVIDGLDHVRRAERPQSDTIFDALPAALPEGVVFVVSVQSLEQLPEPLRRETNETGRCLDLAGFGLEQIQAYIVARLEAAGQAIERWQIQQPDVLRLLRERSGGLPLYLRYIADGWVGARPTDAIRFLEQFPAVEGNIVRYYESLLPGSLLGSAQKYVVQALAALSFPVTPLQLVDILDEAGLDRFAVSDAVVRVANLLRRDVGGAVSIFHDSFRVFLLTGDPTVAGERYRKIYKFLRTRSEGALAQAHLFEYAVLVGDYTTPIQGCTREWLFERLAGRTPPEAIRANVHHALDAAAAARDLVSLFRIGLVAAQLGQADYSYDRTLAAEALVLMGERAAATALVWDGQGTRGSHEATFVLAYRLALAGEQSLGRTIYKSGLETFQASGTESDLRDVDALRRAAALFHADLHGLWSSLAGQARRSVSLLADREPYAPILEALSETGDVPALEELVENEADPSARAELLTTAARVCAEMGEQRCAQELLARLAAPGKADTDLRLAAAVTAARFDLGGDLATTLLDDAPFEVPLQEEQVTSDRYGHGRFADGAATRWYLKRELELTEVDAKLEVDDSYHATYLRCVIAATSVLAPSRTLDDVLTDLLPRLAALTPELGRSLQERDRLRWRAVREHLPRLIGDLVSDVGRRWSDAVKVAVEAILGGQPEDWRGVVHEQLAEVLASIPSSHDLGLSLVDDAARYHGASELGIGSRADGFLRLAALAARLGSPGRAGAMWRQAAMALMGHGYHKDVQLFGLIKAAGKLAGLSPDGRFRRMARIGEWLAYLPDATDGDGTDGLPNDLAAEVASLDLGAGFRLSHQYELDDRWFDWITGARSLARCVASQDGELGWALAWAALGYASDADEDRVQGLMRVVQAVAAAGRGNEAAAFASEVRELARRVLSPFRASRASQALEAAVRGQDPGWEWRNGREGEPPLREKVRAADDPIAFEGQDVPYQQAKELMGGSADDLARLLRGLDASSWWRISQDLEDRVEEVLAAAETHTVELLGQALLESELRRGYRLPLAVARRFAALGNRVRSVEWARGALAEARTWWDPWWGGSLEPFRLIARSDRALAEELLYTTLADTYKRGYPAQSTLPQLLDALAELGGGPYDELWSETVHHADALFRHLPPRSIDLAWLGEWPTEGSPLWRPSAVEAVADRLSEPDFLHRNLALQAMIRLLQRRSGVALPAIANRLTSSDLTQATLAGATAHAVAVEGAAVGLAPLRDALVRAARSGHMLLADSAVAVLRSLETAGVADTLSSAIDADACLQGNAMVTVPAVELLLPNPRLEAHEWARLTFWRPAEELLALVAELFDVDVTYLGRRVLREMDRFGFDSAAVEADSSQLARRFYDYAAKQYEPYENRHAYFLIHGIARVVWQLLGERPSEGAASECLRLLRQYDPDVLCRTLAPRPPDVRLATGLAEAEWLAFTDRPESATHVLPAGDWVTLFEWYRINEQGREEFVLACVAATGNDVDHNSMLTYDGLPMVQLWPYDGSGRLPRADAKAWMKLMPTFAARSGVRPLVTHEWGYWRYGGTYTFAALLPHIAESLKLGWVSEGALDMALGQEPVVRLEEWEQGPSRVGRARPSLGARLLVRRDVAQQLVTGAESLVRWRRISRQVAQTGMHDDEAANAAADRVEVAELAFGL
jgi:hypothetical protein